MDIRKKDQKGWIFTLFLYLFIRLFIHAFVHSFIYIREKAQKCWIFVFFFLYSFFLSFEIDIYEA